MSRLYTSPQHLHTVMHHLTDRDLTVIDLLGRLRALTLTQLARFAFGSQNAARARLAVLTDRDIVARFRRCVRPGSQAFRYTLAPLGAYIHAARTGNPPPRPATVHRTITALAANTHLDHLLAVNDFASRLHHHAPTVHLTVSEWMSEADATALAGRIVRPDAATYLHYDHHDQTLLWFEHDTGTKTLHSLTHQLQQYQHLPQPTATVLVELASTTRETHLHHQLQEAHTRVDIATTTVRLAYDPTQAVWWRLGHHARTNLATLIATVA